MLAYGEVRKPKVMAMDSMVGNRLRNCRTGLGELVQALFGSTYLASYHERLIQNNTLVFLSGNLSVKLMARVMLWPLNLERSRTLLFLAAERQVTLTVSYFRLILLAHI